MRKSGSECVAYTFKTESSVRASIPSSSSLLLSLKSLGSALSEDDGQKSPSFSTMVASRGLLRGNRSRQLIDKGSSFVLGCSNVVKENVVGNTQDSKIVAVR